MKRVFEYHIDNTDSRHSIISFLRSTGYSKQCLSYLKSHDGSVLLNGKFARLITQLETDDHLLITFCDEENTGIMPVPIPLDIIYEDEDLIVINKQPGLPVHTAMGNNNHTLANALVYHFDDEGFVFRCINRLDKDTSGLTIVAKNLYSSAVLHQQMIRREIKRNYLALVEGCFPYDEGTIDAPIGRVPDTILRRIDYEKGEKAVTHFRKLSYYPKNNLSLIELMLQTGRTHQIRVHMKHLGYPLIGDTLYNRENTLLPRQGLHAYKLSFIHPVSAAPLNFEFDLPADMRNLLF